VTIDNAMKVTGTLEARVAGLVNQQLDMVIDDAELDLFATGLLDSLAFVTLLHAVEQEFGITIGVDELEIDSFRSISSMVRFVQQATREPRLTVANEAIAAAALEGA
jgi:acyl carrier protein